MTMTLVEIDPRKLVVDKNVRTKLGDLKTLTASIKEKGVLVPLLVFEKDGEYHVKAGGRRTAAAIKAEAETVPCVVSSNGDERALLEDQLIENLHREDLSAADEAKGFEQLSAFGMTDKEIAAIAGRTIDHVKTALTVAASTIAHGVAARHDLTLDQAAVLAEFDDDKTAVKELTAIAVKQPEDFAHATAQARSERDRVALMNKLRAELTAEGVTIVTDQPTWEIGRPPTRITALADASTKKELTPATHKKCPGHAAYVVDHRFNKPAVIYVCTDPKGNGHRSSDGTSSSTDAKDQEKNAEERRAMLAGNKEWRIAEPVRIQFIRDLVARKTCPKGVLRFVTSEIMADPMALGGKMGPTNEKLVAVFLGKDTTAQNSEKVVGPAAVKREKNDARLPLILLAQIAADREQMMDHTTWRLGTAKSARWLKFLVSMGYTLSDIEKKAAARS